MTDDRTFNEKVEDARSAFYARAKALRNQEWESIAWENCFTVETHAEYRDDLHRWEVALTTLNALADTNGIA